MTRATAALTLPLALTATLAGAQTLTVTPQMDELAEGGPRQTTVMVMLDRPARQPFVARLSARPTTADAGVDFQPIETALTFLKGEVLKQVTLTALDDERDEPELEFLLLELADVVPLGDATEMPPIVATPAVQIAIRDDDHAFTVDARGGTEGGTATLDFTQQFDGRDTVTLIAAPVGGSAAPGADYGVGGLQATVGQGETRTRMTLPLATDDEEEATETATLEFVGVAPSGTVTIEPASASIPIADATEPAPRSAMLQYGPGTVSIEGTGFEGPVPQSTRSIGLRVRPNGDSFVLSDPGGGSDLVMRRACADDLALDAAGEALGGLPDRDGKTAWKGSWTREGVTADYVLFGTPDSPMTGYVHSYGGGQTTWATYNVTPEARDEEETADVPRLPTGESGVVDTGAAQDSVARALAADLGTDPATLSPYLQTRLARGSGAPGGTRPVVVSLWVDADGNPVRTDHKPDPCDPDYGTAAPPARLITYTIHGAADGFLVQSATTDLETGRIESAYMGDFDQVRSGLDRAVTDAHAGLAPRISGSGL